jgi:peptidoglycan L-alanyl-D-glutamate endopeptidase CwlK
MVRLAERAIAITKQDFGIVEGRRTLNRQRELVASGASQTMNSRHLTGHAVDLLPLVNGKPTFDWQYYYPMADAVADAAVTEGVTLIWGGAWGRLVQDWPKSSAKAAQAAYVAERRAAGRKPFLDGPHFELPAAVYPAG